MTKNTSKEETKPLPDLWLMKEDETEHWTDEEFKKKAGQIYTVYLFDRSSHTHLCELTPSYEMRRLYTTYSNGDHPDEVREELISRESLYVTDEFFMCGTASEIVAVRSVDGIEIGNGGMGDVTRKLQNAFFGLFNGETEDKYGWLDSID